MITMTNVLLRTRYCPCTTWPMTKWSSIDGAIAVLCRDQTTFIHRARESIILWLNIYIEYKPKWPIKATHVSPKPWWGMKQEAAKAIKTTVVWLEQSDLPAGWSRPIMEANNNNGGNVSPHAVNSCMNRNKDILFLSAVDIRNGFCHQLGTLISTNEHLEAHNDWQTVTEPA